MKPLKFYVALQPDRPYKDYIRIAQHVEALGFDRVCLYDDLMYKPSLPLLALMAEHTTKIELGPCLVNGYYRHPAILAENATLLDEISNGRFVLGVGRGAFFDFLGMDDSEYATRQGCEETIQLVKRFVNRDAAPFDGKIFHANEKAILRYQPIRSNIPIILASWNEKMAFIAGQYCDELQTGELYHPQTLQQLYMQLHRGYVKANRVKMPNFSIGGMTCISLKNDKHLYDKAKLTMAVYFPYLKTSVMEKNGIDIHGKEFQQMAHYSKCGDYQKAASYISDDAVNLFSLSGTPEQVLKKIESIITTINVTGIMFGPPFGVSDSIEENLTLIKEQIVDNLKSKFS